MGLMIFRRFWLGLTVSLTLVVLLVMALAPWTGLVVQPDHSYGNHSHIGSPIASDNSRDISYLKGGAVSNDGQIRICDQSVNGDKAAGRAGQNGVVILIAEDRDGAGGSCYSAFTGRNAGAHDACNSSNPIGGCGPDSYHPR